ncbi:MAG TPA: class I SAM-dependent methyltransferase [Kofleriaceae bacterium]|nr:class I SAM-dependent methyltransferase [Kofleriaceae bacterium]
MRSPPALVVIAALVACGGGTPPPPAEPEHAQHGQHGQHGQKGQHAGPSDHFHHSFDDAETWAAVFDDPARDEWQKPDELVAALKLAPDARVADVGAGTGYFAVRLARAVPQGKVYAIDIEPDMIRYMGERAQREGLANLAAVLGTADDARIPEPVDVVLVVDTYHHIADRTAYFRRLAGSLRPGGRVVIVDFTADSPIGPPVEHRLSVGRVVAELGDAGYVETARHDFLPNQYVVELTRR